MTNPMPAVKGLMEDIKRMGYVGIVMNRSEDPAKYIPQITEAFTRLGYGALVTCSPHDGDILLEGYTFGILGVEKNGLTINKN